MPPSDEAPTERRSQIIQAALACFMRRGYNTTTMDDIVAESGLSKGTLYWYFKSKDDLLQSAILTTFEESFGQEAFAALEEIPSSAGKLRALAQAMSGMGEWAKGLFNLFLEFWASSPNRQEVGQVWIDLLVQYKDMVVAVVQEGIHRGEFRPVDPEQLVWSIMATYDGIAAYALLMPDLDLQQISETFVDTLLNGLMADSQGRV